MIDWLRPLFLMFYAPVRGMSQVRDRAPLAIAALIAVLAQGTHSLFGEAPFQQGAHGPFYNPVLLGAVLVQSLGSVLLVALIFVPIVIFVAHLIDRRASFGVAMQQDYVSAASTMMYAWAAAALISLPLVVIANTSGLEAATLELSHRMTELQGQLHPGEPPPPGAISLMISGLWHMVLLLVLSPLPFFALWTTVALRVVFRLSWGRAVVVLLLSGVVFPVALALMWRLGPLFSSPFIIIFLFFILRGYFGEIMRAQRARASFKQNLEAATLNPADASAHYNLGLIHQQRGDLEAARQRFERAVEIDADEIDAHYQLGRIARAQNRLADAIKHFEQAVGRDRSHAQYEIWREIGATYLAAGQFEDAREALERFLDHRQLDPEGLYLMGRAHAGLGHQREATSSMEACIEAVKTAPAYKYRTEKRWLNEAQQFIKNARRSVTSSH